MKKFADLTDQAKIAIQKEDFALFADLMDVNFSLRRKIFTDACIGADNLRMVEIAKKYNSAAKLPGSGIFINILCINKSLL